MITGEILGHTGTAMLGTVLGTIGTGTTALGTAGTPMMTGGNQETRKIKITRNTWHSSTAKEKGNDLRLSLWLVVHHHSTQVHQ
jgi:hypothetical protein